jgi:hypothetical protein
MSRDPARWSSDMGELSPDYDAALVAYRGDGPSEAQLTRMLDGVEGTAPFAVARLGGWKLGVACVAAGVALVGAMWLWPTASQRAPKPQHVIERAAPSVPAPRLDAANAPDLEAVEPAPIPLEPSNVVTAAPTAHGLAKQVRRRTAALPAPASAAAPIAVQDPAAELALLSRARRVLAQQPARALELAEEHGEHYPNGVFSEERELLAIESLVALSRHAEAARRGRTFRRQFTQSIHLKRVAELIER